MFDDAEDVNDVEDVSKSISVGLNAVILAVTGETPRVLTVRATPNELPSLPYGPLDPVADHSLERGLRRWIRERTGLAVGYIEQLYTFGDRDRAGAAQEPAARVLSIAYLALTRERKTASHYPAEWRDIYEFLPWEDWRSGRPAVLDRILEALERWVVSDPTDERARRERVEVGFGLGQARWDSDRALERYELIWEAGLVGESFAKPSSDRPLGTAMGLDHRRILATALGRVRSKIRYRPVVFELLAAEFTLLRLQRVVEALAGVPLHKQNFRRLVDRQGLVEGCGRFDEQTGGRPAELFRFRREVERERRAPGVGLPRVRAGSEEAG